MRYELKLEQKRWLRGRRRESIWKGTGNSLREFLPEAKRAYREAEEEYKLSVEKQESEDLQAISVSALKKHVIFWSLFKIAVLSIWLVQKHLS